MTAWDPAHAAHLQVSTETIGDVPLIVPEGELDRWTADSPAWTGAVAEACTAAGAGVGAVVLDLHRLYFMDLDGLASVERFASALAARGTGLILAGVRPRVREFLRSASVIITAEYVSPEEAVTAAAAATPTVRLAAAA